MRNSKSKTPKKILSYKTIGRKTYETASMLLMTAFLLFIVTLGVMLHRALLNQNSMTRYVGLIEKYNGDINAAKKALEIMNLVENQTKNLPKDELPLVAEIKDISKLFTFDVFQSALNGDMALIYTKSKKIFIYRPDIDYLVTEGDFDSTMLEKLTKPEPTPTPTPKIKSGPRVLISTDSAKLATESANIEED